MNDWFRPSTLSRWAAAGPALLAVLLVVRGVVGGGEGGIMLGIAAGMATVAVLTYLGFRLAPLLLLVGPIALVTSPSRTELSFDLARPGDRGWFLFVALTALAAGASVVAAAALAVHRDEGPLGVRRGAVLAGSSVLAAVGFAALVYVVDPQPDLGRDLTAAEKDALPTVEMVSYGYVAEPLTATDGRLQFRLDNTSDLPHTFSVASLDLDVYVPAGREAFVDVAIDGDQQLLDVHCAVGDHRALGMVAQLPVG